MPTGAGQPVPPWVRIAQLRKQLEPLIRDPRNPMGSVEAERIVDQEMAKSKAEFYAMIQQRGGRGGLGVMGRQ
jgi:hypothetical protein